MRYSDDFFASVYDEDTAKNSWDIEACQGCDVPSNVVLSAPINKEAFYSFFKRPDGRYQPVRKSFRNKTLSNLANCEKKFGWKSDFS